MNADDITRNKDAEGKTIGGTSMIRIKGEVKPKENTTPVKPAGLEQYEGRIKSIIN